MNVHKDCKVKRCEEWNNSSDNQEFEEIVWKEKELDVEQNVSPE